MKLRTKSGALSRTFSRAVLLGMFTCALAHAQTSVSLSPATTPVLGQPGVTSILITGSNFPAGTILPASTDVILQPATGGALTTTKANSVTTVVGTTRRVAFIIPSSISVIAPTAYQVSVSGNTTTGLPFASSNKASLTISPNATISTVNPSSGQTGQAASVVVTGQFSTFVQGSTKLGFGTGITVGTVAVTNNTSLTVQITVEANAAPGPRNVTATTGTEVATKVGGFSVVLPAPPTISDFNPKSGPTGTVVNLTGTNLVPPGGAPQVVLTQQGGGTLPAPLVSFSATALSFTVPAGAASGLVKVQAGSQIATSSASLTVTPAGGFTVSANPSSVDVTRGQSAAYTVSVTGTGGFSQLAQLSVSGLPSGVNASFQPSLIGTGQASILQISAPIGQALTTSTVTISGAATVNGIPVNRSASVTLNVRALSTSFLGRAVVDDPMQTPLGGVTVKMLGKDGNGGITGCTGTTTSDSAGNFALNNLAAACIGQQLIGFDGLTVTSPTGKYAGVNLVYTFATGQVTASPVLVHLPRIDNKETFMVQQNSLSDQSYSFSTIPGLTVRVYAGTTFTMADGSRPNPFPLVAAQVPVDRLPDYKPPVPTMVAVFIVAFQPANASTNQPVAVTYPNTLNTPAGTNMTLMTLDPTRGRMIPYGTGTVSANATQVVPDADPAYPGHLYGIVHFDWHGQMPPAPPEVNPSKDPCKAGTANPVDFSSGIETLEETDLAISGGRGGIAIVRTYRTLSTFAGPFGIGTGANYGYRLDAFNTQGSQVINLITPDGNRMPFWLQPNGTLKNTTVPSMIGAVMTVAPNGIVTLRFKDGLIFKFTPVNIVLGSLLASIVDPNGNTTLVNFNPTTPQGDITDPAGRKVTFVFDGAQRIISISDPIGRIVLYTYNSQGTLQTVTDPEGGVTRYSYDIQNRLTQVVDARGVTVVQNIYDANGRVTRQVQADGGVIQIAYVLANPLMPTSPVLQTTVTDPRGNLLIYRYNPQGFLVSFTDALGQTRIFDREAGTNLLLAVHGPASCGVCGASEAGDQSFTYDSNGNRLTVTDSLGNATRYTYEPNFNKVATITNALNNLTSFTYDSHGNLKSTLDPNRKRASFTYDQFGLLTETTDAAAQITTLSYDSVANLVSSTDAMGSTTTFLNDGASRRGQVKDGLGRLNFSTYDRLDRLTSQTDSTGGAVRFAYDAVGNLLSLTDQRGNRTQFTYDSMNRLKTRTTQGGRTDTRNYDLNGNMISFIDRRGRTTQFAYDALDHLTQETYTDSTVLRQYDSGGRLVSVVDSLGGTFNFSYDLAGRLVVSNGPNGALRYTRDALGRTTRRDANGQPSVNYSYDPIGNLLSASAGPSVVTQAFDARNQTLAMSRSNAVNTAYSYDLVGRVTTLSHVRGATTLSTQSYAYDAVGNRRGQTTNIAQPLITESAAAILDNENRLLQKGNVSYAYDANGNRSSESSLSGTTSYVWDSRNRLQSITTLSGQLTTFRYDFEGNLIGQTSSGVSTTYLVDDLTNVVFQSESSGKQLAILTGQRIDEHWAGQSGSSIEFGLPDVINNTVATTSASGSLTAQLAYEPYGLTTAVGVTYPFQYTGRVPVTGSIYYYRARFYDANAGIFLSEDPLGYEAGDTNLYRYVGNNPLRSGDPTGKILPLILGIALIGGIIGGAAEVIDSRGCLNSTSDYARAFGRGFAVGAVAAAVSAAVVTVLTPALIASAPTVIAGLSATATKAVVGYGAAAISGGVGDALGQLASTGQVDWTGTAVSTATAGVGQHFRHLGRPTGLFSTRVGINYVRALFGTAQDIIISRIATTALGR